MQSNNEKEYMDVRIDQYSEINNKLIIPYEKEKIPTILIGDFNISEYSNLKNMLQKLNLLNGPLDGIIQNSIIGTKTVDINFGNLCSNSSIIYGT